MPNLQVNLGVEEYSLNDRVTVSFNPTDMAFTERLTRAFEELEALQEKTRDLVASIDGDDPRSLFADLRAIDAEMRKAVDRLFEQEVSDELFQGVRLYAASEGLPVWNNLLLAIVDEIDDAYKREKQAMDERIRKYTERYEKKGGRTR